MKKAGKRKSVSSALHHHVDQNHFDVGVFCISFICDFYDQNGQIASPRQFTLKILLRHPLSGLSCFYDYNIEYIPGFVQQGEWADWSKPQGTELP